MSHLWGVGDRVQRIGTPSSVCTIVVPYPDKNDHIVVKSPDGEYDTWGLDSLEAYVPFASIPDSFVLLFTTRYASKVWSTRAGALYEVQQRKSLNQELPLALVTIADNGTYVHLERL